MLFVPATEEVYPAGTPRTTVHVEDLTGGLCGASRPTHFDGVTTVVTKLFSIVGPCRAYFGRKDAQQLVVVHPDGGRPEPPGRGRRLPAGTRSRRRRMSSRNAYLTTDERAAASVLVACAPCRGAGSSSRRARHPCAPRARRRHDRRGAARPSRLRRDRRRGRPHARSTRIDGRDGVLVAVAAFVGRARLIDNVGITVSASGVEADLGVLVSESEPSCAAP